jgi:branched-chain amino acid transport system ATP-binding protein
MVKHRRGERQVGGTDLSMLATHRVAGGHAAIAPKGRRLFLDQSLEDNLMLEAPDLGRDMARVQTLIESIHQLYRCCWIIAAGDRLSSAAGNSKWSPLDGC